MYTLCTLSLSVPNGQLSLGRVAPGESSPTLSEGEKALLWAWERGLSSSELLARTA